MSAVYSRVQTTTIMLLAIFAICTVLSSVNGAQTGNVAFSATLDETDVISANNIVKFNNIITNFGDAYNSLTGVFTASKTGLYVFHFHALAYTSSGFWFCLHLNEICLYKAHAKVPNAWGMGGNSIVLRVKSGERVYVKTSNTSKVHGNGDNHYATFTGYMIAAL